LSNVPATNANIRIYSHSPHFYRAALWVWMAPQNRKGKYTGWHSYHGNGAGNGAIHRYGFKDFSY